jgi:hypothetical protein
MPHDPRDDVQMQDSGGRLISASTQVISGIASSSNMEEL